MGQISIRRYNVDRVGGLKRYVIIGTILLPNGKYASGNNYAGTEEEITSEDYLAGVWAACENRLLLFDGKPLSEILKHGVDRRPSVNQTHT